MISETARYHGAFFTLLFEKCQRPVIVSKLREVGTGFYVINSLVPVFLKLSSQRKGPWNFNFLKPHQEQIEAANSLYSECVTCLICGKDGIVGLQWQELKNVLDSEYEVQEHVTVRRKLKTMYAIKGRNGCLEHRVARGAVFEKIQALAFKET